MDEDTLLLSRGIYAGEPFFLYCLSILFYRGLLLHRVFLNLSSSFCFSDRRTYIFTSAHFE